jgi:hypothetical protein
VSVDGPSIKAYLGSIRILPTPDALASKTYALVIDDLNNCGQLAI